MLSLDFLTSVMGICWTLRYADVVHRVKSAPSGLVGSAISFGSAAPEYATTTGTAMQRPDAVYEGRRQVNVQKTNFLLGDDAVDFVSTKMAEEGLQSRPAQTRYRPQVREGGAVFTGAKAPKAVATQGSSWTLGSAAWKPETSNASSFQWPEADPSAGPRRGLFA
jgi:hypothetical protein